MPKPPTEIPEKIEYALGQGELFPSTVWSTKPNSPKNSHVPPSQPPKDGFLHCPEAKPRRTPEPRPRETKRESAFPKIVRGEDNMADGSSCRQYA